MPRLHQILRPRAKLGRADEADIAGRAAKCAATGAFPKSTTPLAPAKPLTLKDVRGKRPAEDAEQRPTRKPRAERTSDVTQIIEADTIGHKVIIRAIKNIRAGAEITYNYGRDYLINVITRRGCKCDKCRKRRADVRAKARPKSRRAPRSRRRKGKNAGNDCRQEPDRDLRTEDRSIWSTPDTEWLYSGGSNNEFKR